MAPDKDGDPASIVLLLRELHGFSKEELCLAAQRAWSISFNEPGSRHFITQVGHVSLLKVGPHVLSFFGVPKAYFDDQEETLKEILTRDQTRIWRQHHAWLALNYVNGGEDRALEYSVLARIAAEMLTDNCVGVFLPESGAFIPNDESLPAALQQVAAEHEA